MTVQELRTLRPQAPYEQTPYEQHRAYVLAVLGRRCRWLDDDEREATFHDAYVVMLEKERAGGIDPSSMHPHQLRAYLTQTAIHKALDAGKRVERKRAEPLGDRAVATPDPRAAPEEVLGDVLEAARVREIVAELPARRQAVVKLRFFHERSPEEIQGLLAISSRVYRRELERGLHHVAERYELFRAGAYCDTRRSLILAYVAGTAEAEPAREAREHLASCPACAHWAIELREAARRSAALVPLPLALAGGGIGRLGEALASVRERLADLAVAAKHHVLVVATRSDPGTAAGYAGSAHPGTVAAVVAGCLAVGGGTATYCAVHGVPATLPAIFGTETTKAPRSAARHPHQNPHVRAGPRPTVASPPPTITATVRTQPTSTEPAPTTTAPAPTTTTAPAPSPPAPTERSAAATEFGIAGSATTVSPSSDTGAGATTSSAGGTIATGTSSSSSSSSSSSPAPPGEFDP